MKSNANEEPASSPGITRKLGGGTLKSAGDQASSESELVTDGAPSATGSFLRDIAALPVAMPRQSDGDREGERLGHYLLGAQLGRGGMGVVYLADDVRLHRRVALKVLPEHVAGDRERRKRFLREARAASAVHHPNIATVFDVGQRAGTLFLAMEYVEGRTLRAVLDDGGKLDVSTVLRLGVQIARAVGCAHEAGIVHRDIKPENVMVRSDGVAKVLDFGIAKLGPEVERASAAEPESPASDDFESRVGQVIGTPGYMSPEQSASSPVDARTDVFSLGVMLIEMLSGVRPRRAKEPPGERARRHAPARLARVLERSVRHSADDRFPSCVELVRELERAEADLAAAARWRPWRIPLAAGFVICAAGAAVALFGDPRAPASVTISTVVGSAQPTVTSRPLTEPVEAEASASAGGLPHVPGSAATSSVSPSAAIAVVPTHAATVAPSVAPATRRSARVNGLITNNLYSPDHVRSAAGTILGAVSGCFSSPDPAVVKTTSNVYQVQVAASGMVTAARAAADPVPALDGCVGSALRGMHLGPTSTGQSGELTITFAAR